MAIAKQESSPLFPAPAARNIRAVEASDLAAWARRLTGITLTDRKEDFLVSRLGRRLAATGSADYTTYLRRLASDPREHAHFAEALTTNTTSFFREAPQFDWLRSDGLTELVGVRGPTRDIVIWSAACSSGQEGYSALMVAEEARLLDMLPIRPRLVGTDLSPQMLRVARQAVYDRTQIRDIPTEMRPRFLLSSRRNDGRYRIVPDLRNLATWSDTSAAVAVLTTRTRKSSPPDTRSFSPRPLETRPNVRQKGHPAVGRAGGTRWQMHPLDRQKRISALRRIERPGSFRGSTVSNSCP